MIFQTRWSFLPADVGTVGCQRGHFRLRLEPLLDAAESRGHHAILRVYLDYPTRPSGVPGYLSDTVGCSPYAEHGGGCSPNYEHPDLKAAILGLIGALGERYDGDPRLGFIQVGLLGFWGEWHTWPHTEMFPAEDMQIGCWMHSWRRSPSPPATAACRTLG